MAEKDEKATGQDKRSVGQSEVDGVVMPCNLTCEKCGSDNINRQHRANKAEWRIYGEPDYENKYAKREFGCLRAKKEHIEHHCRECSFEWQTLPKGQKA